eukprot:gene18948-biopygen9991
MPVVSACRLYLSDSPFHPFPFADLPQPRKFVAVNSWFVDPPVPLHSPAAQELHNSVNCWISLLCKLYFPLAGLGWLGWAAWAGLGWGGLGWAGWAGWAGPAGLGWAGWAGLGWAGWAGLGRLGCRLGWAGWAGPAGLG